MVNKVVSSFEKEFAKYTNTLTRAIVMCCTPLPGYTRYVIYRKYASQQAYESNSKSENVEVLLRKFGKSDSYLSSQKYIPDVGESAFFELTSRNMSRWIPVEHRKEDVAELNRQVNEEQLQELEASVVAKGREADALRTEVSLLRMKSQEADALRTKVSQLQAMLQTSRRNTPDDTVYEVTFHDIDRRVRGMPHPRSGDPMDGIISGVGGDIVEIKWNDGQIDRVRKDLCAPYVERVRRVTENDVGRRLLRMPKGRGTTQDGVIDAVYENTVDVVWNKGGGKDSYSNNSCAPYVERNR